MVVHSTTMMMVEGQQMNSNGWELNDESNEGWFPVHISRADQGQEGEKVRMEEKYDRDRVMQRMTD